MRLRDRVLNPWLGAAIAASAAAGVVGMPPAHAASPTGAARADVAEVRPLTASTVRLNVKYTNAAGTKIAWASVGKRKGKALVLANGTGSPMAEWDPALLAALGKGRRVIVFDYPGLGKSGPPPKAITVDRMADWTAALMRKLKLGTSDVMGWSMGGFVMQRLIARHPEQVRRAVLAATNPGSPRTELGPEWVQEEDSDPNAGIGGYLKTNYPQGCARTAGRAFVGRLDRAVNSGRYPTESVPNRTYNAMVAAEDPWMASSANLVELSTVRIPVLVTTGAEDVVTPPSNSTLMAASIPGASLRLYAASGHSFLFQSPDQVGADVLAFLKAAPASPPFSVTAATRCA